MTLDHSNEGARGAALGAGVAEIDITPTGGADDTASRKRPAKSLALVGYVRLSPAEAKAGRGFGAQQVELERWAKRFGHSLHAICYDVAPGDAPSSQRPGLRSAIELLHRGRADGLLAVQLRRLSTEVVPLVALATDSEARRWHMLTVHEELNTTRHNGWSMVHLLKVLGSLSDEQADAPPTAEPASALAPAVGLAPAAPAPQVAVAQGRLPLHAGAPAPTGNKAPWGWRFAGTKRFVALCTMQKPWTLVPWEPERMLARRVRAMLANGHNAIGVCQQFMREGVAHPRAGRSWTQAGLAPILRYIDDEDAGKAA